MSLPPTYCNPLPLPNYQRGYASRDKAREDWRWLHEERRDFREMADPCVIRWRNRWYLFPSCGLLWWSDDLVNWTYEPIEPDPGYGPTVVEKDGFLYMTANGDRMWRAEHPLGPWTLLGTITDEHGRPTWWNDAMLFVDDDGALYCYHGSGNDGIYVVRLRDDDPTRFAGPRIHCFGFNPEHVWERFGAYNQDPDRGYVEAAWMTKWNGHYYLQYSACGTEWKGYAVGCYVGESPTGPFVPQRRNPILIHRGGLINGCGHHTVFPGPDGSLWCLYTTLVRIEYLYERRVAMDPVGFDEHGEMFIAGPTETPQLAPGINPDPARGNDAGLLPLSVDQPVRASSHAPGREPVYAVDDNIRTWWEAKDGTLPQWLEVDLDREYTVCAARIMFADRGLDYDAGVLPGPYQYRIEGARDGGPWEVLLDRTDNAVDRHIAYDTWEPRLVRRVRLTVLGAPRGMTVGIWEFTVFGRA